MAAHVLAVKDLTKVFEFLTSDDVLEATTIGAIAIVITLVLVFTASKLIGKNIADMFR